jgi:hypothetical protein
MTCALNKTSRSFLGALRAITPSTRCVFDEALHCSRSILRVLNLLPVPPSGAPHSSRRWMSG